MKRKRLISLLLCAATLLLIVPVSVGAYPSPNNGAQVANTRFDFTDVFPVTLRNDAQGQLEVAGMDALNTAFENAGALLGNIQPGDQLAFTLSVKNEVVMPYKNAPSSDPNTPIPVNALIKCYLPKAPAFPEYFIPFDYNVFASNSLASFRDPATSSAYNPAYIASLNLSISGSDEALELAAFGFENNMLRTNEITYNAKVFGANYTPGGSAGCVDMEIGLLQPGETRYVHVWLQFVGNRPSNPNADAEENARLKANHDWLQLYQNNWMAQETVSSPNVPKKAFLAWEVTVSTEILPVTYTVYHRVLGTTTDIIPPVTYPNDGTELYPGDTVTYTPQLGAGQLDYISGYTYNSITPTGGVLQLKGTQADNAIILYYTSGSTPPPTSTQYTVRFVRDTDMQEFPNSTKTFSGYVGETATYLYDASRDTFDGWTFSGRYYPSSSITLTRTVSDNVITLIYSREGRVGYIIRFEDEYGNQIQSDRQIPDGGDIGSSLTYMFNSALDEIDGYTYIRSIPENGTITLRGNMSDNVITLIYRILVDVSPTPPPTTGGDETLDVTSTKPPIGGLPPTGGFNWADLFFVGCGMVLIGWLYLLGQRRRRREEEPPQETT